MGPGGTLRGCDFMVAGTFHVPSAIQKPSVFEATAHGVCLLLSGDSIKSQPLRAIAMGLDLRSNAITLHTPERASERATQFTGRFQAAPRQTFVLCAATLRIQLNGFDDRIHVVGYCDRSIGERSTRYTATS